VAPLSDGAAPRLPDELEEELAAIRADPGESVGFGEKAYLPYEPNVASGLISSDDPAVTQRLLADALAADDRVLGLALLHVLGKRSDRTVDGALIEALGDPELRPAAAYLLGRRGYRGYPAEDRDLEAVRAALRRHLDDERPFEDPFYRRRFRTQDFVLAALVRLAGPERFGITDPKRADLIGYALPQFDDATRAELLARADAG
jgi:hypothetical protein